MISANTLNQENILETALMMLTVNSYNVIYRAFFLSVIKIY